MNPLRTMWYFRFEIFLKEREWSQHKFTWIHSSSSSPQNRPKRGWKPTPNEILTSKHGQAKDSLSRIIIIDHHRQTSSTNKHVYPLAFLVPTLWFKLNTRRSSSNSSSPDTSRLKGWSWVSLSLIRQLEDGLDGLGKGFLPQRHFEREGLVPPTGPGERFALKDHHKS